MKNSTIILVAAALISGCSTLPEGAERITLDDGTRIVVQQDEFTGTTRIETPIHKTQLYQYVVNYTP